ncbi:MAG: peptidylprolyl isomerase [Bacteroidales bacterium]
MRFLLGTIFLLVNVVYLKAQDQKLPDGQILDKVIAVVGNQSVLLSEVEEQYFQMQARGMQTRENEKCDILEQLLFQKLLVVQAQIDSVEVSEKEVEAEIEGRIADIERDLAPTKIEDYFGKSITDIKESFTDIVQDQLIAKKMQGEITKNVKITPSEVKKFFNRIPKDSLPILDASFELSQITRKPSMTAAEKQAQRDRLNAIRERIVTKGEDFKTLAVLYSDDPGSAKNGGKMSGVGRGELVPEFAAAVFNLEVGEVSDIVETEYGIHIIKLEAKNGDKVDFRHILLVPKVSSESKQKAKDFLDSLANIIRTDTLTFEQAAIKYSDDEDSRLNGGRMVNPYTGNAQWEAKQIDPSINFALKNIKAGEISDAFEAKDPTGLPVYKIIFLTKAVKAHTVNLKDDYQMIQEMSLNQKKQDEINKWVMDKITDTYIKIDPSFRNCAFTFKGWAK